MKTAYRYADSDARWILSAVTFADRTDRYEYLTARMADWSRQLLDIALQVRNGVTSL